MRKLLTTLILALYLLSASSLTHVFAMTDEISFHHDSSHSSMNHHWCEDYSKSHESANNSENEKNSDMNCCEILFSSEFSYTKVELDSPNDNWLGNPIWFSIEDFTNGLNTDSNINEVFSPPWWVIKEKKFIAYEDLVWIIKNLN